MGKIKKILENELVGGTQSTDVYPVTSIKAVYDENNERLDNILKRRGTVNISTNYNDDHTAEVLTLAQAIAKVPSADRVLGFSGTFLSADGWVTYRFDGESIADWTDTTKWSLMADSNTLKQEVGTDPKVGMSQKAVTDELAKKVNTADIAQTIGSSTTQLMSQKAVTDELAKKISTTDIAQTAGTSASLPMSQKAVTDSLGIYNVDASVPLSEGFYTASTARAAVPTDVRKLGLIITYKVDATTSIVEQYIGSAISDWAVANMWKQIAFKSELEDCVGLNILHRSADGGKYVIAGSSAATRSGINKTIKVYKGGIASIKANANNNCYISFIKVNALSYAYNPTSKNTWMDGETSGRIIPANESIDVLITEDCYIHYAEKVDTAEGYTPEYIRVVYPTELLNKIQKNTETLNNVNTSLAKAHKDISDINTYIDNDARKVDVTSMWDLTPPAFSGYDSGNYVEVSDSVNVYSNLLFQTTNIVHSFGYNAVLLANFEVLSDERDDVLFLATAYQANVNGWSNTERLHINKKYWVHFPAILLKEAFSNLTFKVSSFRDSNTQAITTKFNATLRLYGLYLIKEEDYFDGLEYLIDYSRQHTRINEKAIKSLSSTFSTDAEHSSTADFATKSDITERYKTELFGKNIGIYGDSLVTFMGINKVAAYLGAYGTIVGQGGGKVMNNDSAVKQGFCTIERIALLPKNMKLLIIYGGANDGVTSKIDGIDQVDPAKLGSIDDEPLKISDMFQYRVTTTNMSETDTPGRTKTFYQSYKTLIRNVQTIFPDTLIICCTQHRYYNYIKPEGGISDNLILGRGVKPKIKAIKDVCEEYSIPVCDLYSTIGVNDHNVRQKLVDAGGVAVHQFGQTSQREQALILNTILRYASKFEIEEYGDAYADKTDDVKELKQWMVDLRSSKEYNLLTLEGAIQQFIEYCSTNSIEYKINMYLVFWKEAHLNGSVGYFLTNAEAPSEVTSWSEWTLQSIDDPNDPNN